jgi:hypothetical protein
MLTTRLITAHAVLRVASLWLVAAVAVVVWLVAAVAVVVWLVAAVAVVVWLVAAVAVAVWLVAAVAVVSFCMVAGGEGKSKPRGRVFRGALSTQIRRVDNSSGANNSGFRVFTKTGKLAHNRQHQWE